MFKLLFLYLFFLPAVVAGDLSHQRLAWQVEGGDVRNSCRAVPAICSKEIGGGKNVFRGISVEGPGGGAGLRHMAHFFALVGKERTYILHELKDKEFVQWLLNHPEVFEKLAFAKASEEYAGCIAEYLGEGRERAFRSWPQHGIGCGVDFYVPGAGGMRSPV